jgi:hypothetical protein
VGEHGAVFDEGDSNSGFLVLDTEICYISRAAGLRSDTRIQPQIDTRSRPIGFSLQEKLRGARFRQLLDVCSGHWIVSISKAWQS